MLGSAWLGAISWLWAVECAMGVGRVKVWKPTERRYLLRIVPWSGCCSIEGAGMATLEEFHVLTPMLEVVIRQSAVE